MDSPREASKSYFKEANPSAWSFATQFFADPYHIDVYSIVIYEQCVNGKLQTQKNFANNNLLYTWSRLGQEWTGPVDGNKQFK
jgi:hypothetical protein